MYKIVFIPYDNTTFKFGVKPTYELSKLSSKYVLDKIETPWKLLGIRSITLRIMIYTK